VLTVRRLTYTSKTMAFYNPLKSFTFTCSSDIYKLTCFEVLYRDGVT
jgi:hypothetical protein